MSAFGVKADIGTASKLYKLPNRGTGPMVLKGSSQREAFSGFWEHSAASAITRFVNLNLLASTHRTHDNLKSVVSVE